MGTKSEREECREYWKWVQTQKFPFERLILRTPNDGVARKPKIMSMLKAEGWRAGYPDYTIPVRFGKYNALVIEAKSINGSIKPEQDLYLKEAAYFGSFAVVCVGSAAMIEVTSDYVYNNGNMKQEYPCTLCYNKEE